MEKLIKQTSLSGYEKIAILLGEIGREASRPILDRLNLQTKQIKKIRKAMKKLGYYDPNDFIQTSKEVSVLSEMVNYVMNKTHAIFKPKVSYNLQSQTEQEISSVIKQNPDAIANVLKAWLKED